MDNVRDCAPLSFRLNSIALSEPTMHLYFRPLKPHPLLSEVRGEKREAPRRDGKELRPKRMRGMSFLSLRPAESPARS